MSEHCALTLNWRHELDFCTNQIEMRRRVKSHADECAYSEDWGQKPFENKTSNFAGFFLKLRRLLNIVSYFDKRIKSRVIKGVV